MTEFDLETTTNVSLSNFSDLSDDLNENWGFYVTQTFGHVIVLAGLVGNCLSLFVMKAKSLRYKSYSHYLCALAVFDSLTLITREIHHVDELLTKVGMRGVFASYSATACKIFMFTESVCCLMSSWLVVSMALERLLVVYVPFRRNVWCTQRGAVVIIISLFIVVSYSQVFRFVMVTIDDMYGKCMAHSYYYSTYFVLHIYIYQICLTFTLPVIIVFFCNISVLHKIWQVDRTFRQDDNSASTRLTFSSSRRSKTTRMLLTIGFVYCFTLLPSNILTIIAWVAINTYGAAAQGFFRRALQWGSVLSVITELNYAVNFYIYVLSGKKFRLELRRIFRTDRILFSVHSTRTREEFMLS